MSDEDVYTDKFRAWRKDLGASLARLGQLAGAGEAAGTRQWLAALFAELDLWAYVISNARATRPPASLDAFHRRYLQLLAVYEGEASSLRNIGGQGWRWRTTYARSSYRKIMEAEAAFLAAMQG